MLVQCNGDLSTYETGRARRRRWVCVIRDYPWVRWTTASRHCYVTESLFFCVTPRCFTWASYHMLSLKNLISYQFDVWYYPRVRWTTASRHCYVTITWASYHQMFSLKYGMSYQFDMWDISLGGSAGPVSLCHVPMCHSVKHPCVTFTRASQHELCLICECWIIPGNVG